MNKVMQVRLVVAAAVIAAIAAGAGNAASFGRTDKSPYPNATFKHPQLKHGVLTIKGTKVSDKITLRLKAGDPRVLEVDVGDDGVPDFSFSRASVTRIAINAGKGNDAIRIDDTNGAFTDVIPTTIDGGAGNDTIAGGKGAEALLGGSGNDTIDGNGGNDAARLGAGDDTFVWDPGDGSDTIEGQAGADTMRFNGANGAEQVTLSANGKRLKFFRDAGNITMDTNGVETVDFNALGGADTITVNDLTGTDVHNVNTDLAGTPGGTTGDGQADSVIVNGTNGNDAITSAGSNGAVSVTGLAATVSVINAEPANDTLAINALGGDDVVNASALQASAIKLAIDGGDGDDVLIGGAGNDSLFGRNGDDRLIGGPGLDVLDGGPGNNILIQD